MDVSDIVEYNLGLLNPNDLTNSYFCLSKNDPTAGFAYDASQVAGHTYPETSNDTSGKLYILPPGAYGGALGTAEAIYSLGPVVRTHAQITRVRRSCYCLPEEYQLAPLLRLVKSLVTDTRVFG